jgi:CRISPR-associated protein Cas5
MKEIDIHFLFEEPKKDKEVILKVTPLAPLSMVGGMPGTYYKSLKSPDKYKLSGFIENILGWHFDKQTREKITEQIQKKNKKLKQQYKESHSASGYKSLVFPYFDIMLSQLPALIHYDDLWKKSLRRTDAVVHPNGTMNMDYRLIREKRKMLDDEEQPLFDFFKNHVGGYPYYYSSPSTREYIAASGDYSFKLLIDSRLLEQLEFSIEENNLAYFGNSESWVHLNLESV